MNFKRILAGVMAGATAISLAACSNSGNGGFDSAPILPLPVQKQRLTMRLTTPSA